MKIYINGRFLSQTITGVQRYAFQVVKTLDRLIEIGQINKTNRDFILATPKNVIHEIEIRRISQVHFGLTKGHLWEQIELPARARMSILWNLANTGPLATENQIVTIHDASPLDHPEWFNPAFSRWYRFLIPALMKRAKLIITDSQYSKFRLTKYAHSSESKITVIYPGVDEIFRPSSETEVNQIRENYSLPRKYLLVVGSLEPRKNLRNLLLSWRDISEELRDIDLVIAGGVGRAFRSLGTVEQQPQVKFIGYVNDSDLRVLYSGALAFIYPSLYEGFGLPPLEAMACGTPVVTSNVTSLPEAVGNAALLIDPQQINSISDSIRKICSDKSLRDHLRTEGFKQIRKFSWDKTVLSIWQSLNSMNEKLL